LEGGAHGKMLWRRVPRTSWYFFHAAWWWWSDGCWQRAGGDQYVRRYNGDYWVAYAWVPPRDGPPETRPTTATGELEQGAGAGRAEQGERASSARPAGEGTGARDRDEAHEAQGRGPPVMTWRPSTWRYRTPAGEDAGMFPDPGAPGDDLAAFNLADVWPSPGDGEPPLLGGTPGRRHPTRLRFLPIWDTYVLF